MRRADVTRMAERWSRHAAHLHGLADRDRQAHRARARARALLLPGDDRGGDRLLRAPSAFAGAVAADDAPYGPIGRRRRRAALRRHLGLCLDVCHAAVEFEDPGASLERIDAAGITVAKLQLSSALNVSPRRRHRPSTCSSPSTTASICIRRSSARTAGSHATPTAGAFAALRRGEAGGEWRVHCHVPVFLEVSRASARRKTR